MTTKAEGTDSIDINRHQITFNEYSDIPPHVRVMMHADETWTEHILQKFLDEVPVSHELTPDDFIVDDNDYTICINSRKKNASEVLHQLPKMVQMRSYDWLDVGEQDETENAIWILQESGCSDREIEQILPSVHRFEV